jgi:hypothetical protein
MNETFEHLNTKPDTMQIIIFDIYIFTLTELQVISKSDTRFEVPKAVKIKIVFFRVTTCNFKSGYQHFGGSRLLQNTGKYLQN